MNWKNLLLEPAILAMAASMLPEPNNSRTLAAKTLTAVAIALVLLALGTFMLFGFMWLDRNYDREEALLIFSGCTLLLALLTMAGAYVCYRYRAIKLYLWHKTLVSKAEHFVGDIADELEDITSKYPKTAAAVALGVGAITARKAGEGTTHLLKTLDKLL